MTWRPSARIVRPGGCTTANLRGMALQPQLAWPDSNINGGADYSVDFSGLLGCGETIQSFSFDAGTAANLAWISSFGTIVTAFLTWETSGQNAVNVCALSDLGNSYQVAVSIFVSPTPSLIGAVPPAEPGAEVPLINSATMTAWLNSLPTSPPASGGYWNNAGIFTYQEPPQ